MKPSRLRRCLERDAKFGRQSTLTQDIEKARPTPSEAALERILKSPPKTAKGKRAMRIFTPQVNEMTKDLLVLRGVKLSLVGQKMLRAISQMRQPYVKQLLPKQFNMIAPWSSTDEFEYMALKNKCPLVCFACTTQLKPLRLFLARMFNWKLYDLLEFDVLKFKRRRVGNAKLVKAGSKPIVLFQGSHWSMSPDMEQAKNSIADWVGGVKASKVALENFDQAVTCTAYERIAPFSGASEVVIDISYWHIGLYKDPAGSRSPQVELNFTGPMFLLGLKQARCPDAETVKQAMRIPSEEFVKGKSSVKTTTNDLKETRQTIHVETESMRTLNLRHGND